MWEESSKHLNWMPKLNALSDITVSFKSDMKT